MAFGDTSSPHSHRCDTSWSLDSMRPERCRKSSSRPTSRVETRSPRQTEVENQQVKRVGGESAIGLHAVFHPINRVPRLTKRVQNGVGQDRVVLRDEYPHASSLQGGV